MCLQVYGVTPGMHRMGLLYGGHAQLLLCQVGTDGLGAAMGVPSSGPDLWRVGASGCVVAQGGGGVKGASGEKDMHPGHTKRVTNLLTNRTHPNAFIVIAVPPFCQSVLRTVMCLPPSTAVYRPGCDLSVDTSEHGVALRPDQAGRVDASGGGNRGHRNRPGILWAVQCTGSRERQECKGMVRTSKCTTWMWRMLSGVVRHTE